MLTPGLSMSRHYEFPVTFERNGLLNMRGSLERFWCVFENLWATAASADLFHSSLGHRPSAIAACAVCRVDCSWLRMKHEALSIGHGALFVCFRTFDARKRSGVGDRRQVKTRA